MTEPPCYKSLCGSRSSDCVSFDISEFKGLFGGWSTSNHSRASRFVANSFDQTNIGKSYIALRS
jgi:hypothetical protein